jgi:hypothetical protein
MDVIGWSGRDICRHRAGLDTRGRHGSNGRLVIVVVGLRECVKRLNRVVDAFAPQIQSPVNPRAFVLIDPGILDNDCPLTNGSFTPTTPVSSSEQRSMTIRQTLTSELPT